jgi:hypothetical protein
VIIGKNKIGRNEIRKRIMEDEERFEEEIKNKSR